jgi:hypothetical protein
MDIQIIDFKNPVYVGGYRIGRTSEASITFNFIYKPKLIHRFFCKIFLGWEWIDNK